MDEREEILIDLFRRLREDLATEYGVGLALKSEGEDFALRVSGKKNSGDEKQPYFALVLAPDSRGYRISYKPGGVTIVKGDSADELLSIVRGYIERERKRLIEYRQR